ncbi:MAG: Crp/Fnr family transcriptional regulator [Brevinema sp.]
MAEIQFKTVTYNAGSYVYVEDQGESGEFYIVRSGKLVEENPISNLTGEDNTVLQPGDFFSVLECMSHRSHLSSLRVLEDAMLIVVRHDQFELLIAQMAPIAMKIIRHFSSSLRRYNDAITHLTFKNQYVGGIDPSFSDLLDAADYYKDTGQKLLAGYTYSKYLELSATVDQSKVNQSLEALDYDPKMIQPRRTGAQEIYPPGAPIFIEREKGNSLYIVLEGQVKITKFLDGKDILLGIMRTKDIFGEMAILDNSPRSATATAADEPVTVLAINKENFALYIQRHPEIARRIIELLSERIWLINRRLSNLLVTDTNARIYGALLILLQKNRVPLQKGLSYEFEMGPEDLARFIGLGHADGTKIVSQLVNTDTTLYVKDGKIGCKDVCTIRSAMVFSGRMSSPKQRTAK